MILTPHFVLMNVWFISSVKVGVCLIYIKTSCRVLSIQFHEVGRKNNIKAMNSMLNITYQNSDKIVPVYEKSTK